MRGSLSMAVAPSWLYVQQADRGTFTRDGNRVRPIIAATEGSAVRYTAVPVPADQARTDAPGGLGSRSDGQLPATFDEVSLFIDDVAPWGDGSLTVVIKIDYGMYMLWPVGEAVPGGYTSTGFENTAERREEYIQSVWPGNPGVYGDRG